MALTEFVCIGYIYSSFHKHNDVEGINGTNEWLDKMMNVAKEHNIKVQIANIQKAKILHSILTKIDMMTDEERFEQVLMGAFDKNPSAIKMIVYAFAQMLNLEELMERVDADKEEMGDGMYLQLCNVLKMLHKQKENY
jgi:hypothetical protein